MKVYELLNYINNNLKEDLKLEDMADMVNYSLRQLYYLFKEITGMPIMRYIRERRLRAAAEEIAKDRRLFDVAIDCGFDTQAGFYKAFLQSVGCSPSNYRMHEAKGRTHQNIPILNQILMGEILWKK